MADFIRVIQYIDEAKSEAEATDMLRFLKTQHGYRGGRVLSAVGDVPWRVQAFFHDSPAPGIRWLPDGCTRVLAPARMLEL